jgi:hypothetical protein
MNQAQTLLQTHLRELGIETVAEYRFYEKRKWRFDLATPPSYRGLLAFEIDGGAYTRGRHTRGTGFIKDMEKMNFASALGWSVFHFTPDQVMRGQAREFVKDWIAPVEAKR